MTVNHSIQTKLDLPMTANALQDFATEVIRHEPTAEIDLVVHMGGHQMDQHPIAVTFTARWES